MLNLIIPLYKGRATLPKALDSLVAQTKTMFLVTIVQDCDGEDYSDIISDYKCRGLHINLIQLPENVGPGLARQAGIDSNPMCEFVMFLDADDILCPEAVETLSREIQRTGADVIMGNLIVERPHDPSVTLPSPTTPVQWLHAKIYRTKYLRDKGIRFLPELRLNEDSYFNLVACNATDKFLRIEKELYLWRHNKQSLTRSKDESFFYRSWPQYVLSQVRGLKKLYELGTVKDTLLGATLNNIYTQMMKAVHLKEDMSVVRPHLKELAECEPLWEQLDGNRSVWEAIHKILKASAIENDEMYFFAYRFIDWINMVRALKDDSNC